ncbi:MAG: hypothetical protein GY711_04185 [bacterium]|nr:hypothetical protein [bacterium]
MRATIDTDGGTWKRLLRGRSLGRRETYTVGFYARLRIGTLPARTYMKEVTDDHSDVSDSDRDDNSDVVSRLSEEHRAVFGVVLHVERELDRLLENPVAPGEHWELPAITKLLGERLSAHFRFEESDGFFGGVGWESSPSIRASIDRLLAGHRDFESRLERITEEQEMGFVPNVTVQRLLDGEVRSLIADLVVHEAMESKLIKEIARLGSIGD